MTSRLFQNAFATALITDPDINFLRVAAHLQKADFNLERFAFEAVWGFKVTGATCLAEQMCAEYLGLTKKQKVRP